MNKSLVVQLLLRLQSEIISDSIKERFRTNEKYFVRNRQLTFSNLVMMRLNIMNKSLSVEMDKISSYLTEFTQRLVPIKQAFSKAVSNIKWEGLKHFNDFFIQLFYQDIAFRTFANIKPNFQ